MSVSSDSDSDSDSDESDYEDNAAGGGGVKVDAGGFEASLVQCLQLSFFS